jgi:hypothetical protein
MASRISGGTAPVPSSKSVNNTTPGMPDASPASPTNILNNRSFDRRDTAFVLAPLQAAYELPGAELGVRSPVFDLRRSQWIGLQARS